MNKNKSEFYAVIDGVIWGLFLFVLGEYIVSDLTDNIAQKGLTLAFSLAVLTSVSFWLVFRKVNRNVFRVFGISCISFTLVLAIIFVNHLFLHITLFPRRELGNADGLLIMACNGVYLLVSSFLRIAVCVIIEMIKKLNT